MKDVAKGKVNYGHVHEQPTKQQLKLAIFNILCGQEHKRLIQGKKITVNLRPIRLCAIFICLLNKCYEKVMKE